MYKHITVLNSRLYTDHITTSPTLEEWFNNQTPCSLPEFITAGNLLNLFDSFFTEEVVLDLMIPPNGHSLSVEKEEFIVRLVSSLTTKWLAFQVRETLNGFNIVSLRARYTHPLGNFLDFAYQEFLDFTSSPEDIAQFLEERWEIETRKYLRVLHGTVQPLGEDKERFSLPTNTLTYFAVTNNTADKILQYFFNQGVVRGVNDETHSISNRTPGTRIQLSRNNFSINLETVTLTEVYMTENANSKQQLYKVFNYSQNVLDLIPECKVTKNEVKPTLFGVELEVSTDHTTRELIDATNEAFFICKNDSSITGSKSNDVELVTVPMSMKAHKLLWGEFFNNLGYDHFDTRTTLNNGLHIHIDRKAFLGQEHIRNLCWFITNPANYQWILELSGRKDANFKKWAPLPTYSAETSKYRHLRNAATSCRGMRGAVNLSKSATIEIRIFQGIVNYSFLIRSLEFVEAALAYTAEASLTGLTLRTFHSWLSSTPKNRFKTLKGYFDEVDINYLIEESTLVDIISSSKDPEVILGKLAKVNVSEDGVYWLNQQLGFRAFNYVDNTITLHTEGKKKKKSKRTTICAEGDKALLSRYFRKEVKQTYRSAA